MRKFIILLTLLIISACSSDPETVYGPRDAPVVLNDTDGPEITSPDDLEGSYARFWTVIGGVRDFEYQIDDQNAISYVKIKISGEEFKYMTLVYGNTTNTANVYFTFDTTTRPDGYLQVTVFTSDNPGHESQRIYKYYIDNTTGNFK